MSYTIAPADLVRDRETVLAVWRRNIHWFTPEEHEQRIDWYRGNPYGPTRVFMARCDLSGKAVGTAGLFLRGICVAGKARRAGFVVDTAVDSDHRMLQPAMLLARAVAGCLSEEIPLIWTYPNHASAGVFRRAGLRDEGTVQVYVKILRSLQKIRRHAVPSPLDRCLAAVVDVALRLSSYERLIKGSRGLLLAAQSPAVASLLARNDLCSPVNVTYTPEFLHWGYEQSPWFSSIVAARESDELVACACCHRGSVAEGGTIIEDLMYAPSASALENVIAAAVEWARAQGCYHIRLYAANADSLFVRTLTRFGFAARPYRPLLVMRHLTLPSDFRFCR